MKPKDTPKQPPAIISGDGNFWYVRIPVSTHYTIGTASRILSSSSIAVTKILTNLEGPSSVYDFPVDHEALLRYVKRAEWAATRSACRKEVARRLSVLLGRGVKICT